MANFSKKKQERNYKAIIQDILVCSKSELLPFITTFSFPPENFEQQKLGTLFGVIKIDDHSEDSLYVTNLLTSIIKKEYFGKPARSTEESFEASLRKANLALAELARQGATSWAGKINFAGGAIERNNLHFACLGNASIFLIRENDIVKISEGVEEEKAVEPHPLKTFSNIASGKLEIGDKLIFTTNNLMDIFSQEELRQNASHFSTDEFPEFLKISLQANSKLAGTIIANLTKPTEAKPLVIETPIIGKGKLKKMDFSARGETTSEKEKPIHRFGLEKSKEIPFTPDTRWKEILASLRIALGQLGDKVKLSFSKIEKIIRESQPREKISRLWLILSETILRGKDIDWRNKKVLNPTAIAVVILVIGLVSLTTLLKKKSEQKRLSQQKIAAQPAESEFIPQSFDDVNAKNIETLEEIINLPQEASQMTFLGSFLYVIPEKSTSLFKIEPNSKSLEEIKTNLTVGNFKLVASMPHLSSLFVLTEDNKVVSFTPLNKSFQENNISLPGNLKAIDMAVYLTYLYFLDPSANQVFRYPRAEGGFGEVQNWLRSGADIKDARNFAINEDLFVASSNDITAYFQGKKDEKINFEKPHIPLAIDKIFSEPDMEGIYVLDNKNCRVVKYGKDGKIISQYFNSSITSVKDFLVDEQNKAVYLLKNNQLFKFYAQ